MDDRYETFKNSGTKNIQTYNVPLLSVINIITEQKFKYPLKA